MAETELFRTALGKAMDLCSRREYCSEDIRIRFQSWGLEEKAIEKILDTLKQEKFIDEKRYTAAFVKDKFFNNKWGKVKISAHLRAKFLPSELIQAALDSIDDESYVNTLKSLISLHRKSVRAKNQYDLKGKLYRFGISRGFESSLLYELLNEQD